MKCQNCQREFESKRADARFCSNKCRALAAKRNRNRPEISATAQAQPQPVTLSDGQAFTPDPKPQQLIDQWYRTGTGYQQALATLSYQYDILKGSARAYAIDKTGWEGGKWT